MTSSYNMFGNHTADNTIETSAVLGDREAFEALVHLHGPALYRYARRMLAYEADAPDVVQETFLAAWRQRASFRGDSSVKTWLFAICSRKISDTYRLKRADPIDDRLLVAVPDPDPHTDPFAATTTAQFFIALDRALAELPARQRATWIMREVDSMTFPEIGTALLISADSARGHHHRATRNLRLRLERWQ